MSVSTLCRRPSAALKEKEALRDRPKVALLPVAVSLALLPGAVSLALLPVAVSLVPRREKSLRPDK